MQSIDVGRSGPVSATLGELPAAASAIRTAAERLDVETFSRWTQQSTESLSRLSDRLVSELLPRLAATESVLAPYLDSNLRNAVRDAHRKIRELAERLSMVSEVMSRSRSRSGTGPVHRALVALNDSLRQVELLQQAALRTARERLSENELAALAQSLQTAGAEARAHIVLVTQPEVDATDAYVLRRRPDLDRAYATNLDAIEHRSSARRGTNV